MPVPYTFQLSTSPIPLSELDANFTYFTTAITVSGTNITVAGTTTSNTVVSTQVDITGQGDLRLQDTTGGQYVALQAPSTIATSYTLTFPVDDGTAGQALVTDGSGVLSWSSAASGDVYGPASATDNAVARYDGTTGKIIQNSAVTIGDDGATVIAANSSSDGLRITQVGTGNALVVEDSANPDSTPFVVTADGRLGVGTPNPQTIFDISGDGFVLPQFRAYGASAGNFPTIARGRGTQLSPTVVQSGDSLGGFQFQGYDGANAKTAATITAEVDGTPGTNDMPGRLVFSTTADGASSPTERMRIRSDGNIGIGGTGDVAVSLFNTKTITGGAFSYGYALSATIASTVGTHGIAYGSTLGTPATAFTLPNLSHFYTNQGTFGAGSTVTNQYGFNVASNLTGATNNYGFYGSLASGTGRWNFYAAGTADNYFAGNVGFNMVPVVRADINGVMRAVTWSLSGTAITGGTSAFSAGTVSTDTNWGMYFRNPTGSSAIAEYTFRNAADTERMRISSAGVISLGATPGAESLRVTPVASAVNYAQIQGAVTGGNPAYLAFGSDTNISLYYGTKGTGFHNFATGTGQTQFLVAHTASAVNYIQVTGGVTGSLPRFTSSTSGIPVAIAGSHTWAGFANASAAIGVDTDITSALGAHVVIGSLNGNAPYIGASNYSTSSNNGLTVRTNGVLQFNIAHTASAVNYLQVTGNTTGLYPSLTATGSDATVGLVLNTKGGASQQFYTGNQLQFTIAHTASAVNFVQLKGSATATSVNISAQGSDTNIDLSLSPKGTGVLLFGTYTAGVVAQAGYITIKDAGGTTRRLLVG